MTALKKKEIIVYKNGEVALKRILALVSTCPKELQEKCFEVLLSGYVQLEVGTSKPSAPDAHTREIEHQVPPSESHIPDPVLPRLKTTAKRLDTTLEKLEALFDFSIDPFMLHAVKLSGKSKAERARQVALLAAYRTYLATGSWSADWQEVKALCVDYNCYDLANHAVNLKKGAVSLFKNIEAGKPFELSSDGIKKAEELLKSLAEEGTT